MRTFNHARWALWLFLVLPLAVHAQTQTHLVPGTNITLSYVLRGNPATATIVSCNQDAAGALAIPGTLSGAKVTAIDSSAFTARTQLTSVIVPSGVTSIGELAFLGCASLESVALPDGLKSIGQYAFYVCSSLSSVSIPASVTSIGQSAFMGCPNLTRIDVAATNPNYASNADGILLNKTQTTLIQAPGALPGAYSIPGTVRTIGGNAFDSCNQLTSVTIPASVTSISESAFTNCPSLTAIHVASTNRNFASSGGVLFNKSLSTLLRLPGGLTGAYTIPAGVAALGPSALKGCHGLTSVTIPAGVTSIGAQALAYCGRLASFEVDQANANFASLGGVLFNKAQTTLIQAPGDLAGAYTVPTTVTAIGADAFANCTRLTSVTLPPGLTSIGDFAFHICRSLTQLTFTGDAPASLGILVFSGNHPDFTIYYPASAVGFSSPKWQGYPAQPYAAEPAAQTITFAHPPDRLFGAAPFDLIASSTSGLPVSFEVLGGPATVSGSTVTLTGSGTVSIRAVQEGDAAWAPAPPVERSFFVSASFADVAIALDQPGAVGGTSGSTPWGVDTASTHDGVDAARSGAITHNQSSVLTLTVTGVASVGFRWKVSSEPGRDHLRFYIDDVEQTALSGEVDWQEKTYPLTPGDHTLRWSYAKDGANSVAADAGWVDQVAFTPATGFAVWAHALELVGPEAAANADPDKDGIPNLLEYALDLDPEIAGTAGLPTVATDGGGLTLTYRRARPELTYTVKTTTDLADGNWTEAGVNQGSPAADGTTVATLPGLGPRSFLRLEVSLP